MQNEVSWRLGKTLDGRYKIMSVLGIGGMAYVYRAYDTKLKRDVAIKVLRDDVAMDAESRRRFRTEYQAVGKLSHPNIRAVYDVVASGDTEYIVMEYVEGISLYQYLKKKGVLTWKEALHFSTQIARALSHAHSRGIIHMDIKPQNIMLPKDGTAKVADFGIAQLEDGIQSREHPDEGLGSIHYISPEQARGEAVDARSDIYSLGVVMYEMLTGRLPYAGDSLAEVAVKHFTVAPEDPTALNPEIPPELEEITLRAMKPKPDDRYPTVDDMLADLDEFRKGQTQSIRSEVRRALAEESEPEPVEEPGRDELHVIARDVPRISTAGELSREAYYRRRSRASRVSMLLGFGIVIAFALALFVFVWNYWIGEIFTDAERLNVPSFVGEELGAITGDEDMTALFDFHITYQPDGDAPAGEIIAQSPEAGASRMITKDGIDVDLVVSSGVIYMTVPDLLNQPYTDAQVTLREMGLSVEVTLVESASVTKNYVMAMEPEVDEPIASGSTVLLVVSAGPSATYTTVPDLVGLSKAGALISISQAGLVCSESEIQYVTSDPANEGIVLWQNYSEGTTVSTGTKVYIEVGAGESDGDGGAIG